MENKIKQKIIAEMKNIPDERLISIYKRIHILRIKSEKNSIGRKRKSTLAGIWAGSQIDDAMIDEAKKSLFYYEKR